MARLGNSLSHLLLALSTSLQEAQVDSSTRDISDVSLQVFAYQTQELGWLMVTFLHTRRHVNVLDLRAVLQAMSLSLLRNVSDPPSRSWTKCLGRGKSGASVLRLQPDSIEKKMKRTPTRPPIFPYQMIFMDERQVGEMGVWGCFIFLCPCVLPVPYFKLHIRPLREEMVKSLCHPAVHPLRGHGRGSGPPTYTANQS